MIVEFESSLASSSFPLPSYSPSSSVMLLPSNVREEGSWEKDWLAGLLSDLQRSNSNDRQVLNKTHSFYYVFVVRSSMKI